MYVSARPVHFWDIHNIHINLYYCRIKKAKLKSWMVSIVTCTAIYNILVCM